VPEEYVLAIPLNYAQFLLRAGCRPCCTW
jgi:hypothetical protein